MKFWGTKLLEFKVLDFEIGKLLDFKVYILVLNIQYVGTVLDIARRLFFNRMLVVSLIYLRISTPM